MRTLLSPLMLMLCMASIATAGEPKTPNEFLARGLPTFVAGTAGDDESDRKIRAQIDLIRGMLFPESKVILDTEVSLAQGLGGWPKNPILYGGPHVNRVVAYLSNRRIPVYAQPTSKRLPFDMEAGKLTIGEEILSGTEYRLITVVPGREASAAFASFPTFLLYAGTGTPGIAEINGIRHGPQQVLVADRFGILLIGAWAEGGGLNGIKRGSRVPWRATGQVLRPEVVPATDREADENKAVMRGLARAYERLQVEEKIGVQVHIYPDPRSKQSLTQKSGSGHAEPNSRTLHILAYDTREGGPMENLVAHEATHVIAYHRWGPAGTPLFAEGLAVWVSGSYGGTTLAEWKKRLPADRKTVAELLGPMFRRLPEQQTYPIAGILTGALIEKIGIEKFRKHLYPATPETWAAACQAAGITPDAVEKLLR